MTQSPGSPSAEQRGSNWEHGADWRWQRVPRIQTQSLIPSLSGGHRASLRSGHGRGASRGKGWIPVPAVPGVDSCSCCPRRFPRSDGGAMPLPCPRVPREEPSPAVAGPPTGCVSQIRLGLHAARARGTSWHGWHSQSSCWHLYTPGTAPAPRAAVGARNAVVRTGCRLETAKLKVILMG